MNKYQEAIFKLTLRIGNNMPSTELEDCEAYLTTLQMLVNKTEPKKVVKSTLNEYQWYECPICKHSISIIEDDSYETPLYCKYCGQALDWEENE